MSLYHRKLYALLRSPILPNQQQNILHHLSCLKSDKTELSQWWGQNGSNTQPDNIAEQIAASSDCINLSENPTQQPKITVKHPISGQEQQIDERNVNNSIADILDWITSETDEKKVFWWFWRFYPEVLQTQQPDALLYPAYKVIPDCPLHSYQSTVSALSGAMFPDSGDSSKPETPYLLIFSFSPVQEFIKASRKFLDFWSGSYLLHYLSVKLCWEVATELGPDAVIVPSLWSQEVFDALMLKEYPEFAVDFERFENGKNPVSRFNEKTSTSLSTAGFPNVITVLVPGKEAANEWGKKLSEKITEEWVSIGEKVRKHIRQEIVKFLNQPETNEDELLKAAFPELFASEDSQNLLEPYRDEIRKLKDENKHGCWEWKSLWEAQLNHSWEPYWTAVPLGIPGNDLSILKINDLFNQKWIKDLNNITEPPDELPAPAEVLLYESLNVGTWWGSLQQRLRLALQSVKNTRNWQIPSAPGERSTISGQFTALHPLFNYAKFQEGGGVSAGSMRLFWLIMSEAYPGLFNGSERLNALEVTKRMAWVYGGVAESFGIDVEKIIKQIKFLKADESNQVKIIKRNQIIYERLLRFPNLSSIASARFVSDNYELTRKYWEHLNQEIKNHLPKHRRFFEFLTRFRSSHVPKTDKTINPKNRQGRNYNGVMFSSKWLADDMGLEKEELNTLRDLVEQAHRATGFVNGSPADWWVIVLADGDGMGSYISGEKLHPYNKYFVDSAIADANNIPELAALRNTRKRMGPATHVGLNRALLDFSNRLVPYLTEKRFCGRVIYSGGDDVMAVLPLEDLPEYILSLRAAWCGEEDPYKEPEFSTSRDRTSSHTTGYWHPRGDLEGIPPRPHFTMGAGATISMGVVIAHKSVPLPTVLESLWDAEGKRAKEMPGKDGICFRVIYGGGNQLEALMKAELLQRWWDWVQDYENYGDDLSPLLYRLAEELPQRACVTPTSRLFSQAAKVIMTRRDSNKQLDVFPQVAAWLDAWEDWVNKYQDDSDALGTQPEDLGKLLRFTAFWLDKRVERYNWRKIRQK
ncbi:MAG: type III-B CRISPR-associated protein Cas10/Cmr2 [Iphinoe sp. HA4291-MV1]|nr:type III-B CRISPR-associated protein Cas10/Cmr2 [Iphinoe sp. HA4291-MV1]